MKRFYFYSYLFTLVIIGCGPELRTVVERDTYNRIILEAELKGEVDTNWVKLHTYHFIGPSTNGPPLETAKEAQSDVSVDDNGNLAKDVPSGLLEYDMENGSKMPLSTFNAISEWEKVKPKKMDKDISNIFNTFYDPYLKLDPFTKKFSDLTLEAKKNVRKLMFDSNKYFEKNSEDKSYFEFLTKVNALNKVINKVGENDKLIELKEKIEEAKKEFIIIEKKLK